MKGLKFILLEINKRRELNGKRKITYQDMAKACGVKTKGSIGN